MTTLVGALSTATSAVVSSPGANQCICGSDFVCSVSGTATSMTMGINTVFGTINYKMGIFDSTGTSLIAETSSASDSTTVGGLLTINLTTNPSLTSGTTYKLRGYANNNTFWGEADNTGFKDFSQDGTFGTWPGTITSANAAGNGAVSIIVDGTASAGNVFESIPQKIQRSYVTQ